MHRKSWPKVVGATVGVLSVGLLLSGCVATAANIAVHVAASARKAAATAGKPHTGQCWQATFKDVDGYANWGGRPAIACSTPHDLYTFAVPTLKAVHKGKLFDKKGFAYDFIENDAFDTCTGAENAELSSVDELAVRLVVETYLPEEPAWNAGARWVRCDIGVLKVGNSVTHPDFEVLPTQSTLNAVMRDAPEQFDFCVNDPGGVGSGGPKGVNAVYADCRDNPDWKLNHYQEVLSGSSGMFPPPAEMKAQYERGCESAYTDATHITYPYYPSTSDWSSGVQQIECWVGRKD